MSNIQNLDQIYISNDNSTNFFDDSYPVSSDSNEYMSASEVAEIINSDVYASELGKTTSRYIELQHNSKLHGFTKSGKYVHISENDSEKIKNSLLHIPNNAIVVPIEQKPEPPSSKLIPVPASIKLDDIQIVDSNFNNLGKINLETVERREPIFNTTEYKNDSNSYNIMETLDSNTYIVPVSNVSDSVSSTDSAKNLAILVKLSSEMKKIDESESEEEEEEEEEEEDEEEEESEDEESESITELEQTTQSTFNIFQAERHPETPNVAVRFKKIIVPEYRIKKTKSELRTEYLEKLERQYIEFKTDDPSWEGLSDIDKNSLRELRRLKQKNTGDNRTMSVLTKPISIQKFKELGKSVGVNSPIEVANLISNIPVQKIQNINYKNEITKYDYETDEIFNFRNKYTSKILEMGADSLSNQTCISLGIMKCNKIKYGVIYDSEMEDLLHSIDSEFFQN